MTYRTILAYADAAPEAAVRLQIAAAIAVRAGATLDGVFIKPPFIPPPVGLDGTGYVPPSTLQALMESHRAFVERATERARAEFQAIAQEVGAQAAWSAIEDDTTRGFISLARCSDLVVFPKAGMASPRLSATDLAGDSGAPILLVPKLPRATGRIGKVLVAWNGSREAADALRGAWPILESASQVEVVMVDPPPEAEAFIGKTLDRHVAKAKIVIDRTPDAGAGEVIRRRAEDLGADLVVMGLYGRSRLRELLLGGASKTMLEQESIPLLVSH